MAVPARSGMHCVNVTAKRPLQPADVLHVRDVAVTSLAYRSAQASAGSLGSDRFIIQSTSLCH